MLALDIRDCLTVAIGPACSLLPLAWDSRAARAALVATALQESALEYRRQRGGPARGYWQFELVGVEGVFGHPVVGPYAVELATRLDYEPIPSVVYSAIEDNDALAAGMARLLLRTVPEPLPDHGDVDEGWRQYRWAWRPGRPRPETWLANYRAGWGSV